MKIKKAQSFYVILAIILTILYIVFAIKPLQKEFLFTPEWKINVSSPEIKENPQNLPLQYFKLGQSAGYFTEDGKVTNFFTFPFKTSISNSYYTCYNSNNTKTDFFTPDAKKAGTISETGFPFISEDKIFVFLPGGSSFVMCNQNGSKKWEHDAIFPITSFSSTKNAIIAGYADGSVIHFDNDGQILQNFQPGGSDYPVILGASISNDGLYIACVSGLNKQRFTLSKKENNQTKIIFHEYFSKDSNLQQIVKFSSDDKLCFFTSKEFAGIVDIQNKKSLHIPISGNAISLKEMDENFILLTKNQKKYSVYVIEKFSTLTGSFNFEAESAFIETNGNNLYVGKNDTISKIKISKE